MADLERRGTRVGGGAGGGGGTGGGGTGGTGEDNAVIIKAQKAAHLLQKEKLQVKCNEEVALVEEMRAYLKRRAEIEFKYCEEQTALAAQYQSTRKLNPKQTNDPGSKLLLKAWISFLDEAKTCAKVRGSFAEKLRENFSTPMKPFTEDKKRLFAKHTEHLTGKIQADLHTSFSELQAAKQLYDQTSKEVEKAQQKYNDAMKVPKGTLSKMFSAKVTTEKLDQARVKLKSTTRKQQDARNAYILKVEATNNHLQHYYSQQLPQTTKYIDGSFFDVMRHYVTEFGEMESQNSQDTIASMEALISAAGKINRDLDNREFIQENGPLFAQVRPFQLELAANDKVAKIEVDDISKVVLSNELSKLTQQLTTVSEGIAKKDKDIEAVKKISKVYDNTPTFGRAADTLDEEDNINMAKELLTCQKHRLQAQINVLTAAGVEIIKSTQSAKKVKREASSDHIRISSGGAASVGGASVKSSTGGTSEPTKQCVALYDYSGQNADELSFSVGDTFTVLKDEGEWIKAVLRGQEGYIPSNYVKKVSSNAGPAVAGQVVGRAQALYDFDGSEEDSELSFVAGEMIEILARGTTDDPDFWEGRIGTRSGFFPAMFVQDLDADEDSESAKSETSTLNERSYDDQVSTLVTTSRASLNVPSGGGGLKSSRNPSHSDLNALANNLANAVASSNSSIGSTKSSKTVVVALYDYDAEVEGELSFRAGERIEVTNKDIDSEDWWEGVNQAGEKGQFPHAYVEEQVVVVVEPPKKSPAPTPRNAANQQPAAAGGASRLQSMFTPPLPPAAATTTTAYVTGLFDFVASNSDELSFRKGDRIELLETTVLGDETNEWWKGSLNGRIGIFPFNYVKRN